MELHTRVVQKQLEAYNKRDLKTFLECYHAEIEVTNLISNAVRCKGIDAFEAVYKNLFETSPHLHCDLKSRITLDHAIIDEEFVTGISKFPDGLHAVAIYGFRDGLIDRVWFPQ